MHSARSSRSYKIRKPSSLLFNEGNKESRRKRPISPAGAPSPHPLPPSSKLQSNPSYNVRLCRQSFLLMETVLLTNNVTSASCRRWFSPFCCPGFSVEGALTLFTASQWPVGLQYQGVRLALVWHGLRVHLSSVARDSGQRLFEVIRVCTQVHFNQPSQVIAGCCNFIWLEMEFHSDGWAFFCCFCLKRSEPLTTCFRVLLWQVPLGYALS